MAGEVLISAENVGKKFCKDLKRSLWYGAKDLAQTITGNERSTALRKDEFWAVRDINFEVRRGECLGLIGHNGAGKSTLLKLLNGLLRPDTGSITMRGRVGALIELGAGFNPILTGRENIYNNAAILGFTKAETDAKLAEIIAFSEIEDFLDMPVQNYSSGMRVRLGFAVASQMEPDILLIDEVLAVGDLGFILKCFNQMDTIMPNTAMIFVSHSMPQVSRICSQLILMNKGEVEYQGSDVSEGINNYYRHFSNSNKTMQIFSSGKIELLNASVVGKEQINGRFAIGWNNTLNLQFNMKAFEDIINPAYSIAIYNNEQRGIAEALIEYGTVTKHHKAGEDFVVNIRVKNLSLSKGLYSISLGVSEESQRNPLLKIGGAIQLQVTEAKQVWASYLLDAELI